MNMKIIIFSLISAAFITITLVIYFALVPSNKLPGSCDEIDLTDVNVKRELIAKNPDARKFIMKCDHIRASKVKHTVGSDEKINFPF